MVLAEFAGDELMFLIAAAIVAIVFLVKWYHPLMARRLTEAPWPRRISPSDRWMVAIPPLALAALLVVLSLWADPFYVAGHADYTILFMAGGMVWLLWVRWMGRLLGISARDDAIDRHNPAAAWAVAGAVLGGMAAYAGSNVGCGPTIWTTLVPAFVATVTWLVLWIIIEVATHVSEAVCVDRDPAAGIRHGGYLLASGIVLGRAMAGDWTSWESTFGEFVSLGSPAAALAALAIIAHRLWRPTPQQPARGTLGAGVLPALIFMAIALAYVIVLGPADIGVHVITYEQYTGHS